MRGLGLGFRDRDQVWKERGYNHQGCASTDCGVVNRLGNLKGDGIGPEIVPASVQVLDAAFEVAGARVEWVRLPLGRSAIDDHGAAVPQRTPDALSALDGWLLTTYNRMVVYSWCE